MANDLVELIKAERAEVPVSVRDAYEKLEQLKKLQKQAEGWEKSLKSFLSGSIPSGGSLNGVKNTLVHRETPQYKKLLEHVIVQYVPKEYWDEARTISEDFVTVSEYPKFELEEEEG